MMDRNKADELPKLQVGFIDFVCTFVYKVGLPLPPGLPKTGAASWLPCAMLMGGLLPISAQIYRVSLCPSPLLCWARASPGRKAAWVSALSRDDRRQVRCGKTRLWKPPRGF